MPSLGATELIIILVIVLAIFGAGRLSTLGGALGRGIKDFRTTVRDSDAEDQAAKPKAAMQSEEESPAKS